MFMKQFRNALDINVDNEYVIKGGYVQMPVPVRVTEDWLNSPSISEEYKSNLDSILSPLQKFKVTKTDLELFMDKFLYAVPGDDIYESYLETRRLDLLSIRDFLSEAQIYDFLDKSDEFIDQIMEQYTTICDLLITRNWTYRKQIKKNANVAYLNAYHTLCIVNLLQLLLLISVNTPDFIFDICFQDNSTKT